MRKLFRLLVVCVSLLTAMTFAQEPVPATFFGMIAHEGVVKKRPFPSVPFGSLRLWDTHTKWLDLEPKQGVYDWDPLDRWLEAAEAHHLEVLYTFGGVPAWASGDRNDPKCSSEKKNWGPGSCHPPADLREDGSGSDQAFKDFVTALAKRAHGRIKYWEIWNEPQNLFFWNGNMAQMVRMAQDMRTIVKGIDPDAMFVSPGAGWFDEHPEKKQTNWNAMQWTDAFMAAGGTKHFDIFAVHAYLKGECPTGRWDSDLIATRIQGVRKLMKKNGIEDMPIWNTEGSWSKVSRFCTSDRDMQVAFVGQFLIGSWAAGEKRQFWYAWDDTDTGQLWSEETGASPAAHAYGEVYKWMVGATLTGCSETKTQPTCTFTRPDGSEYLATWDRNQTCSQGNCPTTPVKVDAKFVDYLDLAGGKTKIQNNTVPVGLKPIWLEAPPAPGRKK